MYYVVYLDEFGHIGPYISRNDRTHNDSPVFGLAGIILPLEHTRHFASWFFEQKKRLLAWEIRQSGIHPAQWEKKGSALYTTRNIQTYRELRRFTIRFLNKIERCDGQVFYVGTRKNVDPTRHDSNKLYEATIREAIKRLDGFCEEKQAKFLMVLDEHQEREAILTAATRSMFLEGGATHLLEPPFQVESHRYQTGQAADWICGLTGRIMAFRCDAEEWSDFGWTETYFYRRYREVATPRSGMRWNRQSQVDVSSDGTSQ